LQKKKFFIPDSPRAFELLDLAGKKFKETLAIRPNDHRGLLNWGVILAAQGSLWAAEGKLDLAENSFENSYEKYSRLGKKKK
jgi:hypothetical protein